MQKTVVKTQKNVLTKKHTKNCVFCEIINELSNLAIYVELYVDSY